MGEWSREERRGDREYARRHRDEGRDYYQGHRRRRSSDWDKRDSPYGTPMPPPGSSHPMPYPSSRSAPMHQSRPPNPGTHGFLPGPNDVVRAPQHGEEGPLAGIDIEALRALLDPHGTASGGAGGLHMSNELQRTGPGGTNSMTQQESRQARRLYVGNLPPDTNDAQVGDFFNRALVASHGVESEGNPIVSVYLNLEKRFAFIETRTVREAAAGLALDGVQFKDMFLRLRRPNDYEAPLGGSARPPDGFNPGVLGIVSTQVSDGPNKVFIGGIPYNLTEDQIKDLLVTYGPLAAFNLIKEPNTGMSKGFAFFEFVDPSVVDAACAGLHGMQVGDKTLTVRRATNSSSTAAGATHASTGSGALASSYSSGKASAIATALLTASTRVVELRNIVAKEELEDDQEYEDIKEDMEEEGSKFGKLDVVVIPRPTDGAATAAGVGRVFLMYAKREEAERAHATMSGRRFGEKVVEARFFDEDRFAARDFS